MLNAAQEQLGGNPFAQLAGNQGNIGYLYCVDLEVWSKLAKCVLIIRIASKCAHNFDCDWQRVNAFSIEVL